VARARNAIRMKNKWGQMILMRARARFCVIRHITARPCYSKEISPRTWMLASEVVAKAKEFTWVAWGRVALSKTTDSPAIRQWALSHMPYHLGTIIIMGRSEQSASVKALWNSKRLLIIANDTLEGKRRA